MAGGGTSATGAADQFAYTTGSSSVPIPSPVSGGWQLNGTAQVITTTSPPNLQLTPATNYLAASAFWPTPVPGVGISAAFDAFIGSGSGADGMTFTLADASVTHPTALGVTAGGEGFSGITGIAVSLDTWQNTSDPSSNFVGIATTNTAQQQLDYVSTNSSIPSLRNTVHHFVVTTTSTGITVTMDGTQVLNYTTSVPSSVLVGFTGATGGFNDVHQVQNVSITTAPPPPAPTVTGVSPGTGPSTGGTAVTITGTNFTGATAVDFGPGNPATAVTVVSSTSITATAPTGTPSTVDVTVTTGGGTSATNTGDKYTYNPPPPPTVTGVSPASGPSAGGTAVTITGTNFTGATAVDFGPGNPATSFTVNNAGSITATSPIGAGTAVDVTVTTGGGTSAINGNDQYAYTGPPPPTVTGVSPSTGYTGTSVTITGTNLSGVTAVNFGTSNPATTFALVSANTLTATVPGGTGTVDVTVTTGGGTSATGAADQYTYLAGPLPPPTVTLVNPVGGPAGTLVSVSGNYFVGVTTVDFGTTAATFTVNGSTVITATAPAGTGTVDVTVTTGAGPSATSAADQFTYTAGPPPNSIPSPVTGGWQLNGTAQVITTTSPANLQLTPTTNWEVGSAFYSSPVPGVGISAAFDAFIGSGSGADGMTFTLADASVTQPTALGDNGGGEAFSGITGIAVSLDTYKNASDPSSNFVGIATTNTAQQQLNYVSTNSSIPSLRNTLHHFVVTTTSTGITVAMDGTQVLTYATSLPQYVLLGFTGATGGGNDIHQVQNVAITTGAPLPAPTVTGVDPSSGLNTGGTTVSITGTGFTGTGFIGASAVHFGSSAATFSVNSSNIITATAPAGTGTVDVTVTTGGGTSAISPDDQYTYIVPPVPTVTGVSPPSGPSTGGSIVSITGTGFTWASAVHFGANAAAKFTDSNDNVITATAPAGNLGATDVTVSTPTGTSPTSAADQFTYVVPPVPTVTGVSPISGPSTGGTSVTITGTGLTGASAVNFGPNNPSATYTVTSDSSITATAPAGTVGTADVTVVTPGGTSAISPADQFTYTVPPAPTVTGVSPGSGPNGTLVTITGTNFTGATAVDFGPSPATTLTVSSATIVYATVPAGTGMVNVTVITPGGTSAISLADQYTYTVPPAPTVTGVSPGSGFYGTSVIVTGTNFTGASAVNFGPGNLATTFTVNSSTSITATVPAGTGTVDMTVTTSGGSSATSASDQFSYLAGPTPPTMVATYRGDLGRSGYYPSETGVTTANVASLKLHWTAKGGTGSYSQPIVANNLVYWGDWNGFEHGTNLTGTDVWETNLGVNTDSACLPPVAGVSGTATVGLMGTTSVLYVPGGDDNFYELNALTGAVMWKTNLGTPPGDYLWSSPILYNGSIYQAVASFGDRPLVQGRLVQMDATTGAIQHTTDMVPNGCTGGGIWSSPAIDTSDGSIYVTTGTPNGCNLPEMSPAIVKMRASDLTVLSSWTIPQSELFSDPDFGSTPTLFSAVINGVSRSLVGALNKDGLFFAWDRSDLAAGPVWQTRIANPAGGPLSIVSASWDGSQLYVGGGNTIINGVSCYENISALNPATGAFIWRSCVQGSMTAGITEVPGVLIEGYGAVGKLLFLNPANGATLLTYSPGAVPEGEATVSNGIVYVSLSNGNLIALGQ
ncbi:MAG TPA: IPT/TIG domain-containing protein [Acidimicrobiales bacterium]|nr:IPT/TIG domain-containing protein [Acidimicrobiales bacterium]